MTFKRNFSRDQSGVSAVMTAVFLFTLIGSLGLAIDLGHYYTVQQELKNAADAGALAGVRALFPYDMSSATGDLSPNCTYAVAVGTQTSQANSVDNARTVVAEVHTGRWHQANSQFVGPWCTSDPNNFTNAVLVTTRRQEVPLFILQVLGAAPRTLQATSIAVMPWAGGLKKGKGFPIAISKKYAKTDQFIKIYLNDDTSDTGCWYLKGDSASGGGASELTDLILNHQDMPFLKKGEMINLFNGVINSAISLIDSNWVGKTVWVPVVDTIKLNQSMPIDGFAGFKIQEIGKDKGKHYIGGTAERLAMAPADAVDSSGTDFGLLSGARLVN